MSERIEVGSIIGGRYKVTGEVLVSHDQDVVLDGTDQVLNRPVSILFANPDNAEQLSQSAREVATGERPGTMQILDLGEVDSRTYMITSHASAPDLLDLLVATEPETYVEPFFTESLGSEIFGESRSREPETYGGRYDETTGEIINYDGSREPAPTSSTQEVAQTQAADVVPPTAEPAATQAAPQVPRAAQTAATPKVTPIPGAEPESVPQAERRQASLFPNAARQEMFGFSTEEDDDDAAEPSENKATRWIVGGVLAAVLVAALIFAINGIGAVFNDSPAAGPSRTTTPSSGPAQTTDAAPGQSQAPQDVTPEIESFTRVGDFDFARDFDKDLPKAIDGNQATYWSNMEFGSADWGGFTKNVSLVVKLKQESTIKNVTLTQLGGSGGSVTVYTNSKPSLDGAKQVASNSFTSTNLAMPLSEPAKAQYVIIDVTALPRLAAPKTQFPFGLRLAEVKVQ